MKKWLGLILVSLLVAGLSLTSIVGLLTNQVLANNSANFPVFDTGNYDDGYLWGVDADWADAHDLT
jgi:hypothetical protein